MDKYEYQLKLDQINKLIERNDYATALKIADNIDWKRVRSVNTLSKIADIYEKNEKYEESRDLLMMAYDRAPVGRMIAYRLADLCIRLEDYDQAIEYYKDFVHSAPKDPAKLILKYKIFRGKGAALKDQIAILEEYRAQEYEEQWALELAYLYEEAGEIEKCVNECDELILWFNDGKYVMKAMELKMRYEPLTPAQQEKYELRMNKTKLVDARDDQNLQNAYQQGQPEEQQYAQEYPEGYDPAYEQEYAGANGYAQNYGQNYGQDMGYDQNGAPYYGNGQQQYGEELPTIQDPESLGTDAYQVESDGQMVLQMPDYQPVDRQITGQMTIQEILSEWEKARQPLQEEENAAHANEAAAATEKVETKSTAAAELAEEPKMTAQAPEQEIIPEEEAAISEEEELPEIAMPEGLDEGAEEEKASVGEEKAESAPAEGELAEQEPEMTGEVPAEAMQTEEPEAEDHEAEEFTAEESEKTEEEPIEEPETPMSEADVIPEEEAAISEEEELPEIAMPEGLDGEIGEEKEEAPADARESVPEAEKKQTGDTEEQEPDKTAEAPTAPSETTESVTEEPTAEELTEEEPMAEEPAAEELTVEEPATTAEEAAEVPEPEAAPEEATAISEEEELPEIAMPEGMEEEKVDDLPKIAMPEGIEEPQAEAEDETETAAPTPAAYAEAEGGYDNGDAYGDQMYEDDDYYAIPENDTAEDEDAADNLESRIVRSLSSDSLVLADADDGTLDGRIDGERIRRVQRREESYQSGMHGELTEDQKKLFTYFAPVHGMSDQLWMALENEKGCIRGGTSNIGNIVIMGEPGSGKTMLAVNLVKAIQKSHHASAGKLAKISAETLNEKDVSAVVRKLNGGALIIERASELTNETAIRLEVAMRGQTGELLFIFEDEKQSLKRFMKLHPKLAAMCTTRIDIPIFNNDELVEFGKCYANELEYSIDEMAVLALYNRIGNMQRDDYDVSVTDVKRIVDAAIEKNEKGGVGKFFSLLTKKRYDDDDCIVLREKDFEE